jgi:hypothetical protein
MCNDFMLATSMTNGNIWCTFHSSTCHKFTEAITELCKNTSFLFHIQLMYSDWQQLFPEKQHFEKL